MKIVDSLQVKSSATAEGTTRTVVDTSGNLYQGGTLVTSTAAELNLIDNADRLVKVAKVAVAAVDTAGGFFSWANDEGADIMVKGIYLDITTQSTGACTVDIGTTATSATTLSDNLIDGLSIATAGLYNNTEDKGINGKSKQRLASAKWVTGSVASGASAGVVGNVYIEYMVV